MGRIQSGRRKTSLVVILVCLCVMLVQCEYGDVEQEEEGERSCYCRYRCKPNEYYRGYCRNSGYRTAKCCRMDCEGCRCQRWCYGGELHIGECRQQNGAWGFTCCKHCEMEGNGVNGGNRRTVTGSSRYRHVNSGSQGE